MSELEAGTVVDGCYEILATIGSGGLGTVYRARDVNDDATVALKMLDIVGDEAQRRFLREFNILSRIRHPRFVRSHKWGLHAGKPYFSMDYIRGHPLSDLIASAEELERLRTGWLVPLIRQIGEGMAYIHEQGVVHRDLKPANIMVSQNRGTPEVTILDLGLARFRDSSGQCVTPPGTPTGTAEYMSPEQIRGRQPDQRSDLYSLGIVLYEILTGKPPFTAENPASVMFQHLRDLPPPPRQSNGGASAAIEESVMKLLEKEPIDRYDSVWSLLRDLPVGKDGRFAKEFVSPLAASRPVLFLQPKFTGREREKKALREILRETGRGFGRMVLVSGEVGIGKSELLEEFRADARVHGMCILNGCCYESGTRAYGPFLEALEALADRRGIDGLDLEREVERVLAQFERPTDGNQTDPYALMEILCEFLVDLSRKAPTLIFIEDLQWADDLTVRFLDFMRRNPDPAPLVFGLACRKMDEEPLPPDIDQLTEGPNVTGVVHLQLEPLDLEETSNLAASLVGERGVPEWETCRIFQETGGNPLFVVELIRGSIEEGLIWRDSSGIWRWPESTEWPMPQSIMQAIGSRLGSLQPVQKHALEFVSIFRGAISFDLISAVWHENELRLLEVLEVLVRLGLLRALEDREGRYRFSHALIQRAVYAGAVEEKRQLLHLKVGTELERRYVAGDSETLDELAYHFSRSDDLKKMARYLTASGRLALRMHNFSHAVEQFEAVNNNRGVFSSDDHKEISRGSAMHLEFLCAYAEGLSGCGRFEDARHLLDEAMPWVSRQTQAQNAHVLKVLGINHIHLGEYNKAVSVFLEALGNFRRLADKENELALLGLLSDVYIALEDNVQAIRYCHSAAKKCREMGGEINEARSLMYLGFSEVFTFHNSRAKTLLESSLELLDQEGDRVYRYTSLYLLGRIEFRLGNLDRAGDIFKELQAYWYRRGSSDTEAEMHIRLGRVDQERGEKEKAEGHARAAERLLTGKKSGEGYFRACSLLAEITAETGRVNEALAWSKKALPGLEYGGNVRAVAWAAKAKSLAAAGRHREVDNLFVHVSKVQCEPKGLEQVYLVLIAGEYYLRRGRLSAARLTLEEARNAAEKMEMCHYARKAAGLLKKIFEVDCLMSPTSESSSSLSQEHLLTLYEASEDLTSILDLNVLLDRILDRLKMVSRAERVLIALKDDSVDQVEVARRHNLDDVETHEISRGIIKWSMDRNEPALSLDARTDERFRRRASVTDYGIRSVLCVPLRHAESGVIGALYMDHRKLEDLFSDEDRALFSGFGNLVSIAVVNARKYSKIQERTTYLQKRLEERGRLEKMVGASQVMQEVFNLVEVASEGDITVLIQGETGTGKELAARAVHARSERKSKPFLSANCAAVTHELLQSELFGHKKGAFTGASSDRKGLFVSADGGTVFLDEIGNASPQLQSSLLRVLQDGEIQRVGEAEVRNVDVRVIAATNRDLEADVRNGLFREDLYYRLRVLQIEMPPLRRRIEDIPLLCDDILTRVCSNGNKVVAGFTSGAIRALMDYNWPGNVRELENEIRRAVALVEEGENVSPDLFSDNIRLILRSNPIEQSEFKARVASFEKRMIVDALDQSGGNITRAASQLGLSRNGLQKKMTRYQLR